MSDYPPMGPNDNECGITVPIGTALIAISGVTGLAVTLRSVVAFTDGLAVEADLLAREPAASNKWQDVMTASGADGLQVGFAFADEPTLTPASAQNLDSTPIWLLHRAGGGDKRFSITWWMAPYPPGTHLIMGMEWKRAGIERRAVAIDVPSPADLWERIVKVWEQ
ncbi:MAG: hypothetical protein ACRDRW_12895 [Pseudonocardiaceae bacterium]